MRLKNTLSRLIKLRHKSFHSVHAPEVREHPKGMHSESNNYSHSKVDRRSMCSEGAPNLIQMELTQQYN